jgi:hypothetical protein
MTETGTASSTTYKERLAGWIKTKSSVAPATVIWVSLVGKFARPRQDKNDTTGANNGTGDKPPPYKGTSNITDLKTFDSLDAKDTGLQLIPAVFDRTKLSTRQKRAMSHAICSAFEDPEAISAEMRLPASKHGKQYTPTGVVYEIHDHEPNHYNKPFYFEFEKFVWMVTPRPPAAQTTTFYGMPYGIDEEELSEQIGNIFEANVAYAERHRDSDNIKLKSVKVCLSEASKPLEKGSFEVPVPGQVHRIRYFASGSGSGRATKRRKKK